MLFKHMQTVITISDKVSIWENERKFNKYFSRCTISLETKEFVFVVTAIA